MKKKILALVLSVAMVVTMMPTSIFAGTANGEENSTESVWEFDKAGWTDGMEFGTTTPTTWEGLTIVGGTETAGTDHYEKNDGQVGTANFYGCPHLEVSETNHYIKFTVPSHKHLLKLDITGCQVSGANSWVSARPSPKEYELGYVNLTDEMSTQTMEFNELPTGDVYIVFEADKMPIKISKIVATYAEELKINFDSMGGTSVSPQTVVETKWAVEPTNPTKKDSFFTGWYKEKSCENKFDFDERVESSMTLYAGWQNVKGETWKFSEAGWDSGYKFGTTKPTVFNGLNIVGGAAPEVSNAAPHDNYNFGYANFCGSTTASAHYMKFTVPVGSNINTLKITAKADSESNSKIQIKKALFGKVLAEQELSETEKEYDFSLPAKTIGDIYICFEMDDIGIGVSQVAVKYNQVIPTSVPDVKGFKCWAVDMTRSRLVWNKSSSPQVEYWIYRGTEPFGDWGSPIAKLGNSTTSYTDYPDAEETDIWFYMIRPVIVTPQKTYFGNYTNMDYAHLAVIDMKGFNVYARNANSVVISWTKSTDPSNDYYIYRDTKDHGDFGSPIAIVGNNETSYIDKNVKCGTKYYYVAKQVTEDGGGHLYSGNYTKVEYGYPRVVTPSGFETWASDDHTCKVKWNRSSNKNVSYWLYRSEKSTGDWGGPIKKFTNEQTSYTDEDVKTNHKYYYLLRAVENIDGKNYFSNYTKMDYAWPRNKKTENVSVPRIKGFKAYAANAITAKLTWNKSSSSDVEYWIYRSTKDHGDFGSPIAKLSNDKTSFSDKNKSFNNRMLYYVMRPVIKKDGKTYFGEYTSLEYAYPRVPTPTGFFVWANARSCYQEWDPSPLADVQHWIYKSEVPYGDWGAPVFQEDNEYTYCKDDDVLLYHYYYYMMRDVERIDGVNYFSEYTPIDYGRPHRSWD